MRNVLWYYYIAAIKSYYPVNDIKKAIRRSEIKRAYLSDQQGVSLKIEFFRGDKKLLFSGMVWVLEESNIL